jgi:hypothetical protein
MLPSYEPLLGFKLSQGEFITYQIGNSPSKRLWQAIRYSHPKGLPLGLGSVLKLGRIKVKVRKIAMSGSAEPEEMLPKCFDSFAEHEECEGSLGEEASCRICFSGQGEEENPLLSPCECAGSIKYIHAECIKQWLKSKIQTKTTATTTSYYWNDLVCELCKHSLPATIYYQGHKIDLISIEYPTRPYLLLEEFTPENFNSSGIHIICVENGRSVHVGRAQEADLRITDISVSRKHAIITYLNNEFILEDNKSKFGTLVKMKKVVSLAKGKNISIQVGRTMFHICVKKRFNWKKCCCFSLKKIAPEWSYITQEGFEHNNLEQSVADNQSFAQSGHSISYVDY